LLLVFVFFFNSAFHDSGTGACSRSVERKQWLGKSIVQQWRQQRATQNEGISRWDIEYIDRSLSLLSLPRMAWFGFHLRLIVNDSHSSLSILISYVPKAWLAFQSK
jgi:hypothetical protein